MESRHRTTKISGLNSDPVILQFIWTGWGVTEGKYSPAMSPTLHKIPQIWKAANLPGVHLCGSAQCGARTWKPLLTSTLAGWVVEGSDQYPKLSPQPHLGCCPL
jgi:hypothetical protein